MWQQWSLKYKFLICPCKITDEVIIFDEPSSGIVICQVVGKLQFTIIYKKDIHKTREISEEEASKWRKKR